MRPKADINVSERENGSPNEGAHAAFDSWRIAVIIPTFNAARTVTRAIESALGQQLPSGYALEVIVADDCSTDETPAIVERIAALEPRLRLVRAAQNMGPSAARNLALEQTIAGWFTPLDSDDFMLPGRIERLIDVATKGGWDVVADNLLMSFEDTPEHVERPLWPGKPSGEIILSLALFVQQNLASDREREELGFLKPLIRRDALGKGSTYQPEMRFAEDYELYTRLLAKGSKACLIDPAGYFAVQQRHSLSRSQKAADFARLVQVDQRLLLRDDLSKEARRAIAAHLRESRSEWVWLRAIEAVKARSPGGLLSCFAVSFSSSLSLCAKLFEQLVVRTKARLLAPTTAGKA